MKDHLVTTTEIMVTMAIMETTETTVMKTTVMTTGEDNYNSKKNMDSKKQIQDTPLVPLPTGLQTFGQP